MTQAIRRYSNEVMPLREAMDRLFQESFLRPFAAAQPALPAIDLAETDKEFILTATVPGLKPEDLKVQVTGNLLELSADTEAEHERKDATYHLRERHTASFRRVLSLPKDVVADQAQAEFENGVLTLTLPKAETHRRKSITVKPKVHKN